MQQLQDYFKSPDGAAKYDEPLVFTFVGEEQVEPDQYGPKVKAILTSAQGDEVEWVMTPAQAQKRFNQRWPDGNEKFVVKDGDEISVKLTKTSKGHDFYAVEDPGYVKTAESKTTTVKAAPTPAPSKPSGNNEWDGTHRQQGYRIGRSGVLQAVIQNGSFSLKDDQEVAAMNALVDDLFIENRKSADRLEKENPSH